MKQTTKETIIKAVKEMSEEEMKSIEVAMNSLYWSTSNYEIMALCEEVIDIIDDEVRYRLQKRIESIVYPKH